MHVTVILLLGSLVASSTFVDGFFLWGESCDIPPTGHCNGKEFNFREHLCCGDQLYPRVTWTESCCSWKMLDLTKEKCCHDFVIPLEEKCLPDPVKHGR
ncbi:hypothetical protein NP493_1078g00024 [Ridgeia piscesae]|uniref:Galaxin-like repeats domain-containing protein n=1 Tax=Ridgeia piscesae TaxID=27915 RepID=A0AAD9NJY5_RIDPI|nr:hypothetical protein NP493_1078g00024 [Ridgeia piscesae]